MHHADTMKILNPRKHRPVVPVLSLIDILAILLIFFVVTMQFRSDDAKSEAESKAETVAQNENESGGEVDQRRLDIQLPSAANIGGEAMQAADVVISIDQEGAIYIDGTVVENPQLMKQMLEVRKASIGADARFELEPDRRAPIEALIAVWDVLTAAGIDVKDVPARLQGVGQ